MLDIRGLRVKPLTVAFAIVLVALLVIVGLTAIGLASPPIVRGLERVQLALLSFVPIAIAVAALGLLAWAIRAYLEHQAKDLMLKEHENEVEMAWVQGEIVSALRIRAETIRDIQDEERQALTRELEQANERYRSILLGILRARPELAHAERQAIVAYLDQAERELARLHGAGATA